MKKLLTACLFVCICTDAHAGTLFDFRNDATLIAALDDESGPVSFTNSGLVATFTASDGSMNITGSGGFGINASISDDDTDGFDVGEWIDITFGTTVTLTTVNIAEWNDGIDQATIYVNEVNNGVITAGGDHTFNIIVPTGQALRLYGTAGTFGNGWWLENFSVDTGAPLGNSAPILAAIGNKAVGVSNALNFTVSAMDVNGDDIILSASNLPSGATFNAVTNVGAVTNTFSWASAAPIGVYTSTFCAADGTTETSETITITVSEEPGLPDNVTFDFFGDADLYNALDDQTGPITYTKSGLVAHFTASDGEMNRTVDGFGINASSLGDATDGFDGDEWIEITFDIRVTLTNIDVGSWGSNDIATVFVDSVNKGAITVTGSHAFDIQVPTGQVLRIANATGVVTDNGWSLEALTVRTGTNEPPGMIDAPILTLTTHSEQQTVNWSAVDGCRYTVLWTSSLDQPFQPQATNDAPTDSWTDTMSTTNDTAFYQLKAQLIP